MTCFLLRRERGVDELLLLRRSERVGTYRGRWAGVSGHVEEGVAPLEQAYREMGEEVGLGRDHVRLLAEGEPLVVVDESIETRWTVHPFLFEVLRPEGVRLDWEHTESRWVRPEEVSALETVPGLAEALSRVYGGAIKGHHPDESG
ncbi:MAG: NUDIX pyrophosphatase [Dehalococcoidia bacterium]